eukprot:3564821-Prymnesium_polylepis.1
MSPPSVSPCGANGVPVSAHRGRRLHVRGQKVTRSRSQRAHVHGQRQGSRAGATVSRSLSPALLLSPARRHTRFPIGISFPAGSGLVAFAAAT